MEQKTATLLIHCPDRKGIVAQVSQFLYHHGANILHADLHQDAYRNLFLMRVEWDLADFTIPRAEFSRAFKPISEKFKMDWRIAYSEDKSKVAIFVSRQDHCLADLLYRHQAGELRCHIPLIISNHTNTKRLANFYQIPFYHIPVTKENKEKAEEKQLKLLREHGINTIVLARYMQILTPHFVQQYPNQIINIHHSFLPAFVGKKPYHQAFKKGVKIIGATSHYVTDQLDNGPIIEQDVIRVSHRDSVEMLIKKGRDLEKLVLSRAVRLHLENRILIYDKKTVIFD